VRNVIFSAIRNYKGSWKSVHRSCLSHVHKLADRVWAVAGWSRVAVCPTAWHACRPI